MIYNYKKFLLPNYKLRRRINIYFSTMETYSVNQINNDISLQFNLKELIFSEVRRVGFEISGVAKVYEVDKVLFLREWINKNYNANMLWFSRTVDMREDIKKWFLDIKSVIVVGENYYHKCDNPYVALYAHGIDYHIRIKTKLEKICSYLRDIISDVKFKISVDTAPVHEKYWAKRAGLGWQGKNTLIINPNYGSWFNIGIIAVNFILPEDTEVKSRCGDCNMCLEACPTKALVSPGILDARRCISYHTIENKADIPENVSSLNTKYVFGCDYCQIVCPWNRSKQIYSNSEICDEKVSNAIKELIFFKKIPEISVFQYSPIKRIGLDLLLRNTALLKRF